MFRRKLRERRGSKIQGVAFVLECLHFLSWQELPKRTCALLLYLLSSCDCQAATTAPSLLRKSWPSTFKEPSRKRRERVDAKQAPANGNTRAKASRKLAQGGYEVNMDKQISTYLEHQSTQLGIPFNDNRDTNSSNSNNNDNNNNINSSNNKPLIINHNNDNTDTREHP